MKRFSLITLLFLTLTHTASAFVVDEFEFTIIDAEKKSVSVKRNKAHDYSRIDSLTIPKTVIYNAQTYNVTEIGFEGFRDLRADRGFPLKKIILPEGLKVIGGKAFVGLYDIKDTTIIPSTVDTIGDYAFADWVTPIQFLSEVPAALGGTQVFRDALKQNSSVIIPCRAYEAYYKVKNWNIWLSRIVDPCLFSDGTYTYQILPEDDSKVAVKALVDNSIQHVTFSTEVTNPDNDQTYLVVKIADNCFKDNATIKSIALPTSIVTIGNFAFYNCKNLQTISLNEGLEFIGEKAFAHDSLVTGTLTIPSSVTSIGTSAFYNFCKIEKIDVLPQMPPTIGASIFTALAPKVSIWIPCNTYDIYAKAWKAYKSIIVDQCIFSDDKYTYQVLSDDNSKVSVRSIVDNGIQNITFSTEVTNPYNDQTYVVSTIADNCFMNNATITNVTLPISIDSIGKQAFYNCKNLQTISLNEGLKVIGEKAFAHDSLVTGTLTIPASVTSIGTSAFYNFLKIGKIDIQAGTPPTIGTSIFFALPSNATIIIPCGSLNLYQNANYWKDLSGKFVSACKPLTLKKGEELTQEDTIVSSIAYSRTFDMDVWQTLYLPFDVDRVLVYDDEEEEYYDINYPFEPGYGGYFYLNKYDNANVEEATITFTTATTMEGYTPYLIQFPTTDGYFVGKDIVFKSKAGEYTLNKSDYSQPKATKQFQVSGNSSVYNQSVSDMYIFRATPVMGKDSTPLKTVDGKDSIKYEFNQQASATLKPFEFGLLPYVVEPSSGISSAPMRMSLRIGRSSGNTGGGGITTSVSETHASNAITYRTGAGELALSLNGLPCQLYSVSGTLLYSSAGGTEEITIPLEKGIYILYSEGKSQKIVL